jgi:hypothetical protein
MKSSDIKALTLSYDKITNQIACTVRASSPKSLSEAGKDPIRIEHLAIWDTGATACAITELFAKKLGLQPTGVKDVSGLGGTIEKKTYLIDLELPNGNLHCDLPVTEIDNPVDSNNDPMDSFGMLIGMDIIGTGDFIITNFENKTTMSFRTPSLKKVCYVEEWKRMVAIEQRSRRN